MSSNPTFTGCVVAPLVERYSYEGMPQTTEQKLEMTVHEAESQVGRLPGRPVCWEHMYGKNKKGETWKPIGRVTKAWIDADPNQSHKRLMSEFQLTQLDNPRLLQKLAGAALSTPDPSNPSQRLVNELSLRHWWGTGQPIELSLTRRGARPGCTIDAGGGQTMPPLWEILASSLDHEAEEEEGVEEEGAVNKTERGNEAVVEGRDNSPMEVIASYPAPPPPPPMSSSSPSPMSIMEDTQRKALSEMSPAQAQRVGDVISGTQPRPYTPAPTPTPTPTSTSTSMPSSSTTTTPTTAEHIASAVAAASEGSPMDTDAPALVVPEDPKEKKIWAMEKLKNQDTLSEEERIVVMQTLLETSEREEALHEQLKAKEHEVEEAKEGIRRLTNHGGLSPRNPETGRQPPPGQHQQQSQHAMSQPPPQQQQDVNALIAAAVEKAFQQRKVKQQSDYKEKMENLTRQMKRKATSTPVQESRDQQQQPRAVDGRYLPAQVVASNGYVDENEDYTKYLNEGKWNTLPDSFEVVASASYMNRKMYKESTHLDELGMSAKVVAKHPFNLLIEQAVRNRGNNAGFQQFYSKTDKNWQQYRNRDKEQMLVVARKWDQDVSNSTMAEELTSSFGRQSLYVRDQGRSVW